MKYYVLAKQSSGCDYTIGCGLRISELKAKDWNSAVEEAIKEYVGDYEENHELGVDEVHVFEVNRCENIHGAMIKCKREQEEQERKIKELKHKEARKKLYDELKKEFED